MEHFFSRLDFHVLLAFLAVFCCWRNVEAQGIEPCPISQNGAVRLWKYGSTRHSYMSGTVQICYKRQWGNICDKPRFSFGFSEAHVVCHQLGYTGASDFNSNRNRQSHDLSLPSIADVHCDKSLYLTILQCSYKEPIAASVLCFDVDDVTVSCYAERVWNNPFDGMIRLQDGSLVTEGRVEVYCNGQWGTVCGNVFNQTSANVVCRQLGYTEAVEYNHLSAISGENSQPIWLEQLGCSSNDTCLASCQQCPATTFISSCRHSQDATVACTYSISSASPPAEVDTCKISTSGNGYAVLVGSIVGGVAGMACIIFSMCVLCYVHTLCCNKPHSRHSIQSAPTANKKDVKCTSSSAPVIRSLDAPPPYTATTSDMSMFTASLNREKSLQYP